MIYTSEEQASLKESKMSNLCLLSELYDYLCQLNATKNSAGCHSAPNQNHANQEQEKH